MDISEPRTLLRALDNDAEGEAAPKELAVLDPRTRAAALVGMLTAATGGQPTVTHAAEGIRIETVLPDDLGPAARTAVLLALAECSRYGHERVPEHTTVWAELAAPGERGRP
ncbi:hypothetical protein [Streptomyces lichenis]|uniref:ATP-binding protein n=1 Tax=Streptomyces lichenis TaxID=2306967 RepID=A0ABT0I5T3_9ACTN|nr:hypothetical protein [Streptomyces lichenis]MCK8676662.1 hypothetical protein [Streptomyces lichenis]